MTKKWTGVRISASHLEKLKSLAEMQNRSMTNYLETLVDREYNNKGADKMKTLNILKLTTREFVNLLTDDNYQYAIDKFKTIENALEKYQEGAKLSGVDEYVNVNEYMELCKENDLYND